MTTESHSALFGLDPQNKPTRNAASGPGFGIEGTTGVAGHKNSAPGASTTGPAAQYTEIAGIERPGAGGSTLEPSQGSNKIADESGGLLNKLNSSKK